MSKFIAVDVGSGRTVWVNVNHISMFNDDTSVAISRVCIRLSNGSTMTAECSADELFERLQTL